MENNKKLHLIGNAHLDPVWLWRWQEGYAEIKATFRSALDRMKEFPEFIFTCGCAAYYQWVEENAPEMFEEIRERVKEGRWVIVGGWWIQPDCNIPNGESFVRHGLYSQRYFYEKFGRYAMVGYNVDSFGHNGMLPQILKKSGMDYYVFMRPGEHEKELPYNLFWWESPDGSRVMAFKLPFSYSHGYEGYENDMDDLAGEKMNFHATLFLDRKFSGIRRMAERRGLDFMAFYGVGNHGGGPTIRNLELIRKLRQEWGPDSMVHSSPDAYFKEMAAKNLQLPVIKDDLQHHASGCYSAHSELKAGNRKAEHRLMTAEKFAAAAFGLLGLNYKRESIERAWQKVMFNQFHDIMGGCSIKEAYQDAREGTCEALSISSEILNAALQKISWSIDTMGPEEFPVDKEKDWKVWEVAQQGTPLVVFNPLSWPVNAAVQVNKDVKGITDDQGTPLTIQRVRGAQTNFYDKWDTLFIGDIPAFGYRVYRIFMDKCFTEQQSENNQLYSDINFMENDFLRVEFESHTGTIKRMFDKESHQEILSASGAVPVVIDEYACDTWAHGYTEFKNEIGRFTDAKFTLLEKGPLRTRLRITSHYNASTLRQDFILYAHRKEIEAEVRLDWREQHKMLKLSFPVNVQAPKATYEIPYGFMERPVNGTEEPGQQWLDVSGENFGLTLINTAKYSYDVKQNEMRMTVVRSPIYADHFGERDEYCEYMDQGIQEFKYLLVPHQGQWQDANIVKKAYELNVPPTQVIETYHRGSMPFNFEAIRISSDNIIAPVFKRAEEGNGYILRCIETAGRDTAAGIELPLLDRSWQAVFKKCEIKTFWIPDAKGADIQERNLLEI